MKFFNPEGRFPTCRWTCFSHSTFYSYIQELVQTDSSSTLSSNLAKIISCDFWSGVRPNRAAVSRYLKAIGTDKAIYSGSKYVGVKKALVFYKGRPPKGVKTDCLIHEYRLKESRSQLPKKLRSMRVTTLDSKREMVILSRLHEMKSMKLRHTVVSVDAMLEVLQILYKKRVRTRLKKPMKL